MGSGGVGEWGSGEVGEWGSGRVGEWGSGEVGEWESGGEITTNAQCPIPHAFYFKATLTLATETSFATGSTVS